ncbi:MAG: protein translocase subunit SecD [Candidatus Nanopelagicales bacterium]
MAAKTKPLRAFIFFVVLTLALGLWAYWPGASTQPRLGLDLQGGSQVILTPQVAEGVVGTLTEDQINQTVEIIRQRVDGFGVAEAEVAVQGTGENAAIVVSVPGENPEGIANLLRQTARLDFRPVLATTTGIPTPAEGVEQVEVPRVPVSADNPDDLFEVYASVDCFTPGVLQGGIPDDPTKYIVTCSQDGAFKYLLEPAFITGDQLTDSAPALPDQGAGGWIVTLSFDSEGGRKLAEASTRLSALPSPQNQFGIVLDGLVQSSPFFSEPILGGSAQIEGNFTVESARQLAQVLKFGALPVSLEIAESSAISPTLGSDQLDAGLIAGLIGLILVAVYLLGYYRLLGVIAILSLALAGVLAWFLFIAFGRSLGFTLTLAGVAGAIVSIGITVDSFVVYFERIRDELREGKSVRVATESGWIRARRTLIAADFVTLLVSIVLYALSVGSVRGFAFTLGIFTVIDLIIAFLFTKPLVTMFGRSRLVNLSSKLTGLRKPLEVKN